MTQKHVEDEELKTRVMIQRVKNKCVRETVKIINQAAINARKVERLTKKIEKDLVKA